MNGGGASTPAAVARATVRHQTLLRALLQSVPELIFFKDRESRYLAVSASVVRVFGCRSAAEIIGRTDFDFTSPSHARNALQDELRILQTGIPLIDKLERDIWPDRRESWMLTTKFPLRNPAGEIVGTFAFIRDVTDKRRMERELEKTHAELLEASRVAGMAEVATGVLHNVGNVLNSLNVSASVISDGLRQSKIETLARLAGVLHDHADDLGSFLSSDPRGRRVPELLSTLAQHSIQERDRLLQELAGLQKNIDHIKEVVAMQQTYATMIGVVEPLDPVALLEDAVRMNTGALIQHEVRIERDYTPVPRVVGEQTKVLQILINLIRNAKYACGENSAREKRITLRLRRAEGDRVQIIVEDTGIGIPPENLTRIFQHGFTTKAKGHGFGLHSAANAAREMKGTLTVRSAGRGKGATFILDLPSAASTVPAPDAATA